MDNGWQDSAAAWIKDQGERVVHGTYVEGLAERLPFAGQSFDLVVSY